MMKRSDLDLPKEAKVLETQLTALRRANNYLVCKSLELTMWAIHPKLLRRYLGFRALHILIWVAGIWSMARRPIWQSVALWAVYLICTEACIYSQDPRKTAITRTKIDKTLMWCGLGLLIGAGVRKVL